VVYRFLGREATQEIALQVAFNVVDADDGTAFDQQSAEPLFVFSWIGT